MMVGKQTALARLISQRFKFQYFSCFKSLANVGPNCTQSRESVGCMRLLKPRIVDNRSSGRLNCSVFQFLFCVPVRQQLSFRFRQICVCGYWRVHSPHRRVLSLPINLRHLTRSRSCYKSYCCLRYLTWHSSICSSCHFIHYSGRRRKNFQNIGSF